MSMFFQKRFTLAVLLVLVTIWNPGFVMAAEASPAISISDQNDQAPD